MKIIECLNGATEQSVGGSTYKFKMDEYGRYTAKVLYVAHQTMFLSRPKIYQEVPEHPLQVSKKAARSIMPQDKIGAGKENDTNNEEAKKLAEKQAADAAAEEADKIAREAREAEEKAKLAVEAEANQQEELSPQQRAAKTRAANKAAKEAEEKAKEA